jgi:hypothetical protein
VSSDDVPCEDGSDAALWGARCGLSRGDGAVFMDETSEDVVTSESIVCQRSGDLGNGVGLGCGESKTAVRPVSVVVTDVDSQDGTVALRRRDASGSSLAAARSPSCGGQ